MTTAVFKSKTNTQPPSQTTATENFDNLPIDETGPLSRHLYMKEVFRDFRLVVRDISRKTEQLEQKYPGLQRIQPNQLARYLGGLSDVHSKTLYTVELALPPMARQMYRAKVLMAEYQVAGNEPLIS